MVCPICRGKSEVGVFCSDCYMKRNLKVDVPSLIEVQLCRACNSFLLSGKWVPGLTEEEAALRAVKDSVKTNMQRLDKAGVLRFDVEKNETEYIVHVIVTIGSAQSEKQTIVRLKNWTCPHCGRMTGGYYEAIIQLRGNVDKKTIDHIMKSADSHKDRYAFVAKVVPMHGGYDLYLGSKKSAEKIVKEFKKTAETKKSSQLVGFDHKAGKSKFRFSYLIRI